MITCIDTHTAGSPTRVVVSGIPKILGNDIKEKKEFFKAKIDYLRTSLMCEPRGHFEMTGAVITEPVTKESDFGLIFMDNGGYMDMCGHALIGATTAAIETGIVESKEETTKLVVDTVAGQVTVMAETVKGIARSITIENVPSFFVEHISIDALGLGKVPIDISYGGNFFAIVDAKEINLEVKPENIDSLMKAGLSIRDAVNRQVTVKHPILGGSKVEMVEFSTAPTHPDADLKNASIYGSGQVDREPCGTGTCAKMAALYAKGKLKLGEEFVHEGILGTLAKGRIIKKTKVGDVDAVIPTITESAYITGIHQFLIDPDDPLKHGFILR